MHKRVIYLITIVFFFLLVMPLGAFSIQCEAQTPDKLVVYGYVQDLADDTPAVNYTIEFKGEYFKGNSTTSDRSGYYQIEIPSGDYTITVFKEDMIYKRLTWSFLRGEDKRLDLFIDSRLDFRKLRGYVFDAALDIPAKGYTVNLSAIDSVDYELTTTDFFGNFEFILRQGDYKMKIEKGGEVYWEDSISIVDRDRVLNITIKEKSEEERPFEWLNLNNIISDIIDNWFALVALIVLIVAIPIILTVLDRFFDRMGTKKFKFLDEKALAFIENITKYNVYIAFIILLLFILSVLFPGFNDSIWKYVAPHIPAIYTIVILFILMRLLTLILRRVGEYLRGNLSTKPKLKLSPRYVGVLEIVLKYLILLIFGINIIIIALAIFGMGDLIYTSFTGFLGENSGYLIFIITIVIIMYFSSRFMGSFIADMKKKETARISPQVADMVGRIGKIAIYILGGMIIVFALLQMAQMGQLGTTLIMMLSMIIGIVVAMAATGSIGNILSGLVLNAFRPYNLGDRVKIGDTIGDIIDTNLVFVRIRTLNNELVDIPNNNVIGDKIYNFSRSGAFAVSVDVSIGFNVPSELVKKLLVEAARDTKDIEDDPRPYVIITNLGDYAVTYKLRAYTTNAKVMFRVRSNLMANIQEVFYSHGVEILSPWYLVRRDEKMPTEKEIIDSWETTDKKTEEVFTKDVEEGISGGFGLMDMSMTDEKKA